MKYRHDPDRPEEPILEASPHEINAHRKSLRHYLRSSWHLDDADVEDAVQDSVIVACKLIAEKRVRGSYAMAPEIRLLRLLRRIARNVALNIKRTLRSQARVVVHDESLVEFVPDAHSAEDVKLEARETLEAVCDDDATCVRVLVRIAMGDDPADVAREFDRHVNTIYSAVQRGRNKVMKKHRNGRR